MNYIVTSLEAWNKEVTRPLIIPKCTGYDSNLSSYKNIPTFINFVHSRVLVAGKICIHFSQFSEVMALYCKNINAPDIVLCSNLCQHNPTDPKVLPGQASRLAPLAPS